jgi:hypothetical protein
MKNERLIKGSSLDLQLIVDHLTLCISEAGEFVNLDMQDVEIRKLHDKIYEILDVIPEDLVTPLLRDASALALRVALSKLNATLHSSTEIGLAKRYLAADLDADPFQGSWINGGFTDLLNTQIAQWIGAGVDIMKGPVVVVGGGALPQTQVFLRERLRCEVITVESHDESASLCEAVLNKLRLGRVHVRCMRGEEYDYGGCSLVVVATLVSGKADIARRVFETGGPATYFAPRSPLRAHAMWREPINTHDIVASGWKLLSSLEPKNSSVSSLLFKRRA